MQYAGMNLSSTVSDGIMSSFAFLAGTLVALIDCMYIVTSRIFNLVVLDIFVSIYCFTVLILFMFQSSLQATRTQKTYLLTQLVKKESPKAVQ